MSKTAEMNVKVIKNRTGPVKTVIVGAGNRTNVYSTYAIENPAELQIVGIVEPDHLRRIKAAERFNVPEEQCFDSIEAFVLKPKFADAVINGTMDEVHVQTTIPVLKAGYDVLLEKPIGTAKNEILELNEVAAQYNRKVMICHVLRYAPFYKEIKRRVIDGAIGDIINIQTAENVGYDHMGVSFVRGKWNNKETCKSSMLLAKCCHDLDIVTWLMSGTKPKRVSSFGSLMHFRPEKAPAGAGSRCLVDCKIENECPFSAKKNYIDQGKWGWYAWRSLQHLGPDPTLEQKIESLRTDNPYGRCVWHSDNDVVDHQSVAIEFENGTTATHNLMGGSAKACRNIHIIGEKGEIQGCMEDGYFIVRYPDARKGHEYKEERIDISISQDMHGGGDLRLVEDFVSVMKGNEPSISTTSLEDSINGHLIVFAADQANEENKVVNLNV
ncbi:Gfo/Idh/MocA family protein [Lederbergia lenta]|uniref:Oxidoreductase n=1 Tax=Lederbergia lenta TaxID=1467 RepID=A0A2X4WU71_LEDLE|nr:Gfo/Idh/MocA family oxidoreductase [Lederbergia lenta]MCM3112136.1 Gfo/Idh/MocA family oxidoreductase [Lederbergia lenta]MEC2323307.1 Gfo/Idh/MocA family oxidoreductase [Lederbergia lenta]SQI63168.1 oxidoreductase [Lederbergia lenta]